MSGARSGIRVLPDAEAAAGAAARLILTLAQTAVSSRSGFNLALSGGSTPRPLYSLLAAPPVRESLPWQEIHVFWADERCVPPDHEESNYKLAKDALLSRVLLPAANIHRIRGEEGPERAALLYEEELRFCFGTGIPRFDLIILGVGEDGHTASLFPGAPAVLETGRSALPVSADGTRPGRVTLSLPVLNNASYILFLATGRAKAKVVQEIIEATGTTMYPAGMVRPGKGEVLWIVDREAASRLSNGGARGG